MAVKFVRKHMQGYQPIIEADEGYLVGGRMADSGPVFDTLYQALTYMTVVIEENERAYRSVNLARSYCSKGRCHVSRMIHL